MSDAEKYKILDAPPTAKEIARNELLEKLSTEERAALDAAEREHGEIGRKIAVVVTVEGAVIVKRPHRLVVKAFIDGKATFEDMEKVSKLSLVYPSKEAFVKLLEELPAAAGVIAGEVLELAGMNAKAFSGK